MKKLLVFLLIVLLLCGINLNFTKELKLSNIFPVASVEVFTSSKTFVNKFEKIDNGVGEVIFCEMNELDYILDNIDCVSGLTLKIDLKNNSKNKILKSLDIVDFNETNFGIYGFSNIVKKVSNNKFKLKIEEKVCNFQYFESKSCIFVGIPLLLGSY